MATISQTPPVIVATLDPCGHLATKAVAEYYRDGCVDCIKCGARTEKYSLSERTVEQLKPGEMICHPLRSDEFECTVDNWNSVTLKPDVKYVRHMTFTNLNPNSVISHIYFMGYQTGGVRLFFEVRYPETNRNSYYFYYFQQAIGLNLDLCQGRYGTTSPDSLKRTFEYLTQANQIPFGHMSYMRDAINAGNWMIPAGVTSADIVVEGCVIQ